MPTTLSTPCIPSSGSTSDVDQNDSLDFRSETIGRLAARMNALPSDVLAQLLTPHVPRLQDRQIDPLESLMAELIKVSSANEPSASNLTEERNQAIIACLAVALRWLYQSKTSFGEPLRSRMLLKSVMPLYLAAGQGQAGKGIVDTISLIRMTCMITELNRLTTEDDLAAWSKESNRSNVDPFETIPNSFRIALPKMAQTFWSDLAAKSNRGTANVAKLIDVSSVSPEKHRAWWSLAGQLCSQRAQITIPPELSVGVIAWEKLRDHWQRVAGTLSGEPVCNSVKNATSPSVAPLAGKNEVDVLLESQSTRKGIPKESNELQKCKMADDHRFVEIRSARDPQLSSNLDQLLQQCRNDQGSLSLIVVKKLGTKVDSAMAALQNWQTTFIEYMDTHGEASNVRGFISDQGELSLVFQDVERAELAQWIRDSFAKFNSSNVDSTLATAVALPLVSGVAMVNAPSRSFKIDQLIQAAWRCLEGASTQGAGAVKTIEVY